MQYRLKAYPTLREAFRLYYLEHFLANVFAVFLVEVCESDPQSFGVGPRDQVTVSHVSVHVFDGFFGSDGSHFGEVCRFHFHEFQVHHYRFLSERL
jgi:hypothetical protein